MSDAPIRIELVSDPMYLCGARELVACIAHRVGFDDISCSKIALAVDEAMCNVIRHGYKRDTARPIWVTITPSRPEGERPGAIEVVIEDEAEQVDPERIVGRALDDVRPGGLGVHIMREVMDLVEYSKREPGGMRLRMVKRAQNGPVIEAGTDRGSHSPAVVRASRAAD